MEFKDLLTIYWSQFTLLFFGVGYFIKRIFDNKSKIIELNHSLFQQNRINAVNDFFSNYAKVEIMWNTISYDSVFLNNLDMSDIDNLIIPPYKDLQKSLLQLRIYFKTDDHRLFKDLTNGLLKINTKLFELYVVNSEEMKLIEKHTDFETLKKEILKNNDIIMNELCERIKKSFNKY